MVERAYISLSFSLLIDKYFYLDIKITILLYTIKSGDISLNDIKEKEYYNKETKVVKELKRLD